MGKLENIMKKRADDKAEADRAFRKAESERKEQERNRHIAYYKSEFNKRFAELKELVDGQWDHFGWGWNFQYHGKDYWISYDYYHYEGHGPDDYDMDGHHWVLKSHFNASASTLNCYTLTAENDTDPLTKKVFEGLEALNDPNRFNRFNRF